MKSWGLCLAVLRPPSLRVPVPGQAAWAGAVSASLQRDRTGSLSCLGLFCLLWSECPPRLIRPLLWLTWPFLVPRDMEGSFHVALRPHPFLHSGLNSLFPWLFLVNGGCYHLCKISSSERVTNDGSCLQTNVLVHAKTRYVRTEMRWEQGERTNIQTKDSVVVFG